jgi:[acyl-carrier-protein] S-malonyltransferase
MTKRQMAFLFPGQGSQYPGMGKDFAEHYSEARNTFEEADDVLGRNLSRLIFYGDEAELKETKNSQLGIFVTSIALLRVIQTLFPELQPVVCSGLSLGEYTALTSTGRINFSDALKLVHYRSQFMNDACEATQGTMAVILGLEGDVVEDLVKTLNMPEDLWVANYNSPGQVVISGTLKGIEAGSAAAKNQGAKRILPLAVHGAFHSGLMRRAEERLTEYVENAPMGDKACCDLVMNVNGDYVKDLHQIREFLIKQVTHSVRWEQGIRVMAKQGIELFLEIGCGKTLAGLNKRIGTPAETISIERIGDLEFLGAIK